MAALTILVAGATSLHLLPTPLLVLPFVASTAARRFGVTPADASIDAEGLWIGDTLVAPRADILDAWADPDDTDRRVSVAVKPDELVVVHLPNAEQAQRFARELRPSAEADRHVVAGVRPRAIDALMPLRLLGVALSLVANADVRSPAMALVFAFFAYGAYGFVAATQIDASPAGLVTRRFFGERLVAWKDVTEDVLAKLPARIVRSPLLATSPWTKNAHRRVLDEARRRMKDAK